MIVKTTPDRLDGWMLLQEALNAGIGEFGFYTPRDLARMAPASWAIN
jgi:hypothetical protein